MDAFTDWFSEYAPESASWEYDEYEPRAIRLRGMSGPDNWPQHLRLNVVVSYRSLNDDTSWNFTLTDLTGPERCHVWECPLRCDVCEEEEDDCTCYRPESCEDFTVPSRTCPHCGAHEPEYLFGC